MDAKDLMIGNYVYYNDKIISISPNAVSEFYYLGETHSDSKIDRRDYKPIPLSEEILLNNCDFKQVDIFSEYRKGSITLGLVAGGINQWQLIINGFCTSVILNYLHELQKVYKIFEKQDLQINF